MRVLISGATGLVGLAAAVALRAAGHTVERLVRPGSPPGGEPGGVRWNPTTGELDQAAAEGADAVIHLAGASIAAGRWSEARKAVLRASRVEATRGLVNGLGQLRRRPAALLCASAIGYYGDRGNEQLAEPSRPGTGFLSALACDWEAEAARAAALGMRVVMLRFGIVLSRAGGALPRMLLPFRLGLGGKLGGGGQWMSWITLPDVVGVLRATLEEERWQGPLNVVAPGAVTNAEFTRVLARVLRRPAIVPAPAFALRLVLGEMADALLLASQRVVPAKLEAGGYGFLHRELEAGLRAVLGR